MARRAPARAGRRAARRARASAGPRARPHAIERRPDAVSVSLIKCYTRLGFRYTAARGLAPRWGPGAGRPASYTRTKRVTKTPQGPESVCR